MYPARPRQNCRPSRLKFEVVSKLCPWSKWTDRVRRKCPAGSSQFSSRVRLAAAPIVAMYSVALISSFLVDLQRLVDGGVR